MDVNEEEWLDADLAIRSSYEGALIEGLSPLKESRQVMREGNHTDGLRHSTCHQIRPYCRLAEPSG